MACTGCSNIKFLDTADVLGSPEYRDLFIIVENGYWNNKGNGAGNTFSSNSY